jgi:hypothetical protein
MQDNTYLILLLSTVDFHKIEKIFSFLLQSTKLGWGFSMATTVAGNTATNQLC